MVLQLLLFLLALQGPGPAQDPAGRPEAGPIIKAVADAPIEPVRRIQILQALQARDYPRAEALLVEESARVPNLPFSIQILGRILFLDGKYLESAVVLKKADSVSPLDNPARFTLAMSYVILKRLGGAREELEKLARSDPRNALYPYWLGRLAYDDGWYREAASSFSQALELDPHFVKALDNLGLAQEALGESDQAIESYQRAIRLNREAAPSSPWPPLNLASLLLRLGRYEEAESWAREALRYGPDLPQAHYKLGIVLEKRGKLSESVAALEHAAVLLPSYLEPHYALARIYRANGEKEKARNELAIFENLKARSKE